MINVRPLCLLVVVAVGGCTQPSLLASYAERNPQPAERLNPGTAPPDKWNPAPDEVDDEFLPNTERISKMPRKVGECFETTITSITDRYGEDIAERPNKRAADPGTIVRFSNSGVQVSLRRENSIVHSQVFDKVNMCLVEVPKECPGDLRGRIYKTTNLRTKESWSLANDIKNCGGPAG